MVLCTHGGYLRWVQNVTGYRYITHLYCLKVDGGFYSVAVQCRTESSGPGSISGREKLLLFPFFSCYTTTNQISPFADVCHSKMFVYQQFVIHLYMGTLVPDLEINTV